MESFEQVEESPNQAGHNYLNVWMSKLSPHTPFRKLVLPGSHDSNTYDLKKPLIALPFATCQILSIREQLEMGIRYLDLRYTRCSEKKSNKALIDIDIREGHWEQYFNIAEETIRNGHGIAKGGPLFPCLLQLKDFVQANPSEFIIVKMQQAKKSLSGLQKRILCEFVSHHFKDIMILETDLDSWFKISSVTMGDIWNKKVNVLFLMKEEIFNGMDLSDNPNILKADLVKSEEYVGNVVSEQVSGDELCRNRKISHLAISELSPPTSPSRLYKKKKKKSKSKFKANKSDLAISPESINRAKLYLSKIGIFEKNRLVLSYWFNKDNFEDLRAELDKYNKMKIKHKFKVHQMVFTAQSKFHLKYVFKPPTILRLEKSQFSKNYQMTNYIIELLNSNLELNIGGSSFSFRILCGNLSFFYHSKRFLPQINISSLLILINLRFSL